MWVVRRAARSVWNSVDRSEQKRAELWAPEMVASWETAGAAGKAGRRAFYLVGQSVA